MIPLMDVIPKSTVSCSEYVGVGYIEAVSGAVRRRLITSDHLSLGSLP